jgi:hypothetical protein
VKYSFAEWIPAFPPHYKGEPWKPRFGVVQFDGFWLREGKQLPNWDPNTRAYTPDGPDVSLDFMFADHAWPMFSSRLRQLLDQVCPGAFQFLPVVFGPKNEAYLNTDFSLGQALHLIDGFDRDKQKVDSGDWTPRANGSFRTQYPYYVHYDKVKDYPVFRLLGSSVQLFIRSDIQKAIEESGLTGCRFDRNHPICT